MRRTHTRCWHPWLRTQLDVRGVVEVGRVADQALQHHRVVALGVNLWAGIEVGCRLDQDPGRATRVAVDELRLRPSRCTRVERHEAFGIEDEVSGRTRYRADVEHARHAHDLAVAHLHDLGDPHRLIRHVVDRRVDDRSAGGVKAGRDQCVGLPRTSPYVDLRISASFSSVAVVPMRRDGPLTARP